MLVVFKSRVDIIDERMCSPLHVALEVGSADIANLLIIMQSDLNKYEGQGRTPIMIAMESANPRLFSMLLKHKPNLDVLDSAVEAGMKQCLLDIINQLNEETSSISAAEILKMPDQQGRTALHHA